MTKMFFLLQRSKSMALDAKKEAESALESVKGSVEKFTNDFLNKSKAVKEDGKKKTNETVSNIHANGHAVTAGKEVFARSLPISGEGFGRTVLVSGSSESPHHFLRCLLEVFNGSREETLQNLPEFNHILAG